MRCRQATASQTRYKKGQALRSAPSKGSMGFRTVPIPYCGLSGAR